MNAPPPDQSKGQVRLPFEFLREPDRNFEKGGRSFYFFDFDDNVVHLPTKIVIFHKSGIGEQEISTTDFALIAKDIGKKNTAWEDYELRELPDDGSYRNFREQSHRKLHEQPLILDMEESLKAPFLEWRGPSWDFFWHAVHNTRPIAVITARGQHPHTIRRAIDKLVLSRDLSSHPNYLSVYPVTHPTIRKQIGDENFTWTTAQLKKAAIKAAVKDAFECYGENPFHRFGMSDDDPHNIALIREAMLELKNQFPNNAFYVINTAGRQLIKEEIFLPSGNSEVIEYDQLALFGDSLLTLPKIQ
jgi:hypothetical protein